LTRDPRIGEPGRGSSCASAPSDRSRPVACSRAVRLNKQNTALTEQNSSLTDSRAARSTSNRAARA